MPIDKRISTKLNKFTEVFNKARETEANESDTVMYLIKFFEEVLGYDPLMGEITKEVPIKERHCDFSVVLVDTHVLKKTSGFYCQYDWYAIRPHLISARQAEKENRSPSP
jgi:hypothetical protein